VRSLDEVGDGKVMAPVFALARQVAKEQGLDKSGWRAVVNTGADANQLVFHIHVHVMGGRRMSWPPG
jgi:histidine triad (HIT) family protein